MRIAYSQCDHPRCRRKAVMAVDVRPAWGRMAMLHNDTEIRHYELCENHEREYFPRGIGFVEVRQAERIRTELIAS